jgi:chemotaxis protein methyltransferase CheR
MNSVVTNFSPLRPQAQQVSYTPLDFSRIAEFLHQTTGIRLTEANDRMVYARLASRVLEVGLTSFSAYLDQVLASKASDEMDRFISALTTNTTHFYREGYHFEFLETNVFPDLINQARSGGRIRIWSAGCSTGEEAYSIAICLLRAFPDAPAHDVKILATDIDLNVLARAKAATYAPNTMRDLSKTLLETGFDPVPDTDHFTPKPQVRSLVTFRPLNLIEGWPFHGPFDVIFCRNVAIYMDADTQEMILTRFRDVLREDGHLFIGHSERLAPSLKSSFTAVGNTIYRRLAAHGAGR